MYCSRCGAIQTVKHLDGRPRPICQACGHVDYQQLKVGAGVLLERDGALLLVQRAPESDAFPGAWSLPAGYCEVDEPPPVAAAREAAEETGLRVQVGRLVAAHFFDDDPRGNGLLLVYDAKLDEDAGEIHIGHSRSPEVAAVAFFSPNRLPRPLCRGGHDQAIHGWQLRALDRWQPGTAPRYCPHCTHRLEERLAFDRLRPVCPACGFVHFRAPKVGVSVLIECDGQILLVQRAIEPGLGKWCLPAGFVEWDEDPTVAATRECEEETGLAVTNLTLLEVTHYTDDYRGPGINLAYGAQVRGGALQPGDDAARARWFSPAELPPSESIAFPSHRILLKQWQAA